MEPLKQFICDRCGCMIERPEDGYVVWKTAGSSELIDILIVHRNYRDDDGQFHGCDCDESYTHSMPLDTFLGYDGMVYLLSMMDSRAHSAHAFTENVEVKSKFLDFFRRVQIPYYEEARLYADKAAADGYISGLAKFLTYPPEDLKLLIEKYRGSI